MGVAIAREFQKRDPQAAICFAGTPRSLDSDILTNEGYHLESIDVAGLKGMRARQFLSNLRRLPRGLGQSWSLLQRFQPDAVVGVGGYSSGPVLLVAALRRRPIFIVEPNAMPGITNRLLAGLVREAAVAFPEARRYLRGKGVETGIPVRPEFFRIPPRTPGRPFHLLVFGGSQGSRAVNDALCDALADLKNCGDALRIVHQTGPIDLDAVRRRYEAAGFPADVRAYIHNMPEEFAQADLIISRAGASTLAELMAAGRAAILIPLPTAADDHQRKNAEALARRGAARMMPQAALSGVSLAAAVRELLQEPQKIAAMAEAARTLGRPAAATQIVDLVLKGVN